MVINNQGGNIFRLINPNEGENAAREFLETPHQVNIELLAGAFGASHAVCRSNEELSVHLNWLFEPADHPCILELRTDLEVNAAVFKEYYNQMKQV